MRIFALLITIVFSLYSSETVAQQLGYYSDYKTALSVAQKEQKPLILVVVTSYCPWCRKLERKSLASPVIDQYIKAHFISLIVDRNKDADRFPKIFQTPRIPTVFYIDPDSTKAYWETVGYLSKSEFSESIHDAQKIFEQRDLK